MFSGGGVSSDVRLWVERGFGRREIVPRMLAAAPSLSIISTGKQPIEGTSILDYPSLSTPEGIRAINRLIEANGVDALWPQRAAHYDLSDVNAEVHAAATPEVIALVDDKARFAEWLGDDPFRADTTEVIGATGVASEYARRHANGQAVCVKPVVGVNGEGYWHLREAEQPSTMLDTPEKREMHPELYLKAMELYERDAAQQRLIVMEYLPGPEVSNDVLCWRGIPLLHAARTKLGNHTQRIQSDHPTIPHAYRVAEELKLHGVVSMQYRLDAEGTWKMLEVNPRPAAGSINSEDAGFSILTGWAKLVGKLAGPSDLAQFHGDVTLAVKRIAQVVR
ncbi:MAG TPA: ATP-grasp domain-containing protein [Candidatus Saccharimonadales bacterium]|nr:ATP-grasp domain-containing protein [Candidatus Saccharimonadales bacterium]